MGELAKTHLRLGDRINATCIPHEVPRKGETITKMRTLYVSELIANNVEVFGRKPEEIEISGSGGAVQRFCFWFRRF